ncbi:hypothetical protein F5880DRAFT_1616648 [Lentinula raphanica]|nr:hypothetical protein F5880DRAFT_1616648 [Lentinula raphanica]
MSDAIDIESEEKTTFEPSSWIGKGKKWDNPPLHVCNACNAVFETPPAVSKNLPTVDLPVTDFLQVNLPPQSYSLNTHSLDLWFNDELPNIPEDRCVEILFRRPMPSLEVLQNLKKIYKQKWLDGRDLFPLWALELWQRLSTIADAQKKWVDAYENIRHLVTNDPAVYAHFPTTNSIFGQRSWCGDVTIGRFHFTTFTFLGLLQTCMLNDDIAQAMTQVLQTRLELDLMISKKEHYIAASRFASVLRISVSRKKLDSWETLPQSLRDLEELIDSNPNRKVWFPVLLNSHEVAVCIDFQSRTLAYGDTLKHTGVPKEVLDDTQKWLKARFGGTFKLLGNTLTHGEQYDGISCIPATMNTIAHGIFGDALWTHEGRFADRIRWFTELVPDKQMVVQTTNATKPTLENLLNPQEETVFDDLMEALCDEWNTDMQEESIRSGTKHPTVPTQQSSETSFNVSVPTQPSDEAAADIVADLSSPPKLKAAWGALFSKPAKFGSSSVSLPKPKKSAPKKRPASPVSDEEQPIPSKRSKMPGTSKAAVSERKARENAAAGIFDPVKREKWKREIEALVIHHAPSMKVKPGFDDTKLLVVRCLNCDKDRKVQKQYNTKRFEKHFRECIEKRYDLQKTKVATSRTPKLTSETVRRKWDAFKSRVTLPNGKPKPQPCGGLTEDNDARIPQYLRRSAASGGGARSITTIAQELFSSVYRALSPSEKATVNLTQEHEHTWKNNHQNLRVFSRTCARISPTLDRSRQPLPCDECISLLKTVAFKNVLRKEMPPDERYKFNNKIYRNEILAEHFAKCKGLRELFKAAESGSDSIFVKFAQGAIQGKYADQEVFIGLVRAMVQKIDRDERGVGMQNFKYAPAWDEFVNIISIHSPRAHKFLAHHFAACSARNIKLKRSRTPKMPLMICPATFTRVKTYLNDIAYDGPVAISCDDTKLFSTLQLYWDGSKESYFLVGGTGGPIKVVDPDSVQKYMNNPNVTKGTKVRLWTLQIPLPKMSPTVIAALPITESMTVNELLMLHKQIIFGLLDTQVNVVSYASDGTQTERSVQREFAACADSYIDIQLPVRQYDEEDSLSIQVPVFRGHPIVMVQDSKHALKTFRNNLFSGARLLALGNFAAFFQQIRDVAFEEGSPLYHRDVEKLDRQDDNAASRLFSAPTLQYLIDQHPEEIGTIVYLFVFGEVCDAYQNRHISHSERINIALRTYHFVDMWRKFIDRLDCYKTTNFISRESINILRFITHGLVSLIVIYRDFYPNVPLVPWLHSTEVCEHFFGLARQIVKDFALLDFHCMMPKLTVQIRESMFSAQLAETTKGSTAAATGYHHTYSNMKEMDIMALGHFPSNLEINLMARKASDEADSLWALLGIAPDTLHSLEVQLPGIDSFTTHNLDDAESEIYDDAFDLELEELQHLIHLNESNRAALTHEQQDRLEVLVNATVATTIEDNIQVCVIVVSPTVQINPKMIYSNAIPELDDETYENFLAEERHALDEQLAMSINVPNVNVDQETSVLIATGDLDNVSLDSLVVLREKHQTYLAARSVRIRGKSNTMDDTSPQQSLRCQIIREFYDGLKGSQDRGLTMGDGRDTRWHGSGGNAANAATVAKATAKQALAKRRQTFLQSGVPFYNECVDCARVTEVRPLQIGDYGFIWTNKSICLGKVITMYSKTGGKNGKHAAVPSVSNIAALSYIAIQLFEHMHMGQFRVIPTFTSPFQTKAFALIPHTAFLMLLTSPAVTTSIGMLKVPNADDMVKFNSFKSKTGARALSNAMVEFRKRAPKDLENSI